MKVTILGVGTELTTGQILNRNGQWLSIKLKEMGIASQAHVVVPDDRALILSALEFCEKHSNLIFITGGLGPTSDDFTRDLIAEWSGQKMQWHEESWKHIQERLKARNVVVRDIQKQQCYFPEKATVLFNKNGTANAFSLKHKKILLYALPGPPREIEGLWDDVVGAEIREMAKNLDPYITKSWDTIGYGESDVAHLVEKALVGCDFEKGYRVHFPYVEFKVTFPKSQEALAQHWLTSVDQVLAPMTALKDGADAAKIMTEKLSGIIKDVKKIVVCDEIDGSLVLSRLFPFAKNLLDEKRFEFLVRPPARIEAHDLYLHLKEDYEGAARAGLQWGARLLNLSEVFPSPYKAVALRERERQYFTEMALLYWARSL